jgi:hypothetical protein
MVTLQGDETVAIAPQRSNLTTAGAIIRGIANSAGACINRCCTSQDSTQSWLTSTTISSVVIFSPPLVCQFWASEIDTGC